MAEFSHYNVGETESGIEDGILKNKLGIKSQKELEDAEAIYLAEAYEYFFKYLKNKKIKFNLNLLFKIHKYFLDPLYDWAGKIRTVDISKSGVLFVPAKYLRNTLQELEKIIKENLPKEKETKKEFAKKLAVIHCEFNAIHPFREGNGRTIRLFLDLLAISEGHTFIDFSKSSQKTYIAVCVDGMKKDYRKMQKIILKGLQY